MEEQEDSQPSKRLSCSGHKATLHIHWKTRDIMSHLGAHGTIWPVGFPADRRSKTASAASPSIVPGVNKKYVELVIPAPVIPFMPSLRPRVPFDSVTVDPSQDANHLRDLARRILDKNFRPDILIE